jgi:hypothetical protein
MMSFDDLRVVGFEGAFEDVCGYAFPFVRRIGTDEYFDLSTDVPPGEEGVARLHVYQSLGQPEAVPEPDYIYSKAEADALFEEGNLVRLPEEVRASPGMVVVYLTDRFLDAIEQGDPSSIIREHDVEWRHLYQEEDELLWVTCATEAAAVGAFEHWAQFLMQKSSRLLVDCFRQWEHDLWGEEAQDAFKEVGELCDIALTVAQNNLDLQSRIYLHYGVTLLYSRKPDALSNLYTGFVHGTFTTEGGRTLWDRETFHEQVDSVARRIKILARLEKPITVPLVKWLNFTDKEQGYRISIDELIEKLNEKIESIKKLRKAGRRIVTTQEILAAQAAAEEWRLACPVGPEVLDRFMLEIERTAARNFKVGLDYEFILALGGEPAFYLYDHNSANLKYRAINHENFFQWVEELNKFGVQHGPLANLMMRPIAVSAYT